MTTGSYISDCDIGYVKIGRNIKNECTFAHNQVKCLPSNNSATEFFLGS